MVYGNLMRANENDSPVSLPPKKISEGGHRILLCSFFPEYLLSNPTMGVYAN